MILHKLLIYQNNLEDISVCCMSRLPNGKAERGREKESEKGEKKEREKERWRVILREKD